jgi:hypothetical protein
MTSRPVTAFLAILGFVLLVPSAHAQRGFRGGGGRFSGQFRTGRVANNFGLGWGYLPPGYPDEGPAYWPPAQPQFIPYPVAVEQPSQAPAVKPVEPLLMEEQGGQWVRLQNENLPSGSQGQAVPSASQAAPLPTAVIVFRDGHHEEVAKYMIQGNALYTSSDYWSTGSWTRKISVSDLDVPATLKLNQERGTKFNLPSSPSEVMIRF